MDIGDVPVDIDVTKENLMKFYVKTIVTCLFFSCCIGSVLGMQHAPAVVFRSDGQEIRDIITHPSKPWILAILMQTELVIKDLATDEEMVLQLEDVRKNGKILFHPTMDIIVYSHDCGFIVSNYKTNCSISEADDKEEGWARLCFFHPSEARLGCIIHKAGSSSCRLELWNIAAVFEHEGGECTEDVYSNLIVSQILNLPGFRFDAPKFEYLDKRFEWDGGEEPVNHSYFNINKEKAGEAFYCVEREFPDHEYCINTYRCLINWQGSPILEFVKEEYPGPFEQLRSSHNTRLCFSSEEDRRLLYDRLSVLFREWDDRKYGSEWLVIDPSFLYVGYSVMRGWFYPGIGGEEFKHTIPRVIETDPPLVPHFVEEVGILDLRTGGTIELLCQEHIGFGSFRAILEFDCQGNLFLACGNHEILRIKSSDVNESLEEERRRWRDAARDLEELSIGGGDSTLSVREEEERDGEDRD